MHLPLLQLPQVLALLVVERVATSPAHRQEAAVTVRRRATTAPAAVVSAFLALGRGLDAHAEQVPCRRDPEPWFATAAAVRQDAARRCQDCPVLDLCAAYADAAGEQAGVWGGVDREARAGKPAAA